MQRKLWSTIGALALVFAAISAVSAKEKSWEIDIYGDDVDITYVPDGRNDVHVYDHNNPWNDRSYIEVERPRYRPWRRHDDYPVYGYGYHDDYRYVPRPYYDRRAYRPSRYRVVYHNRYYRGW